MSETKWTFNDVQQRIIDALLTVPENMVQREDGLRCSHECLPIKEGRFYRELRGLIHINIVSSEARPGHTIWASCRDLRFHALTPPARAALSKARGV